MESLSAVRAYVGGEGLWSKGEKDAVHHLARYAETRDERDYRRYLDAIAVPMGDKQARLELEKPAPDPRVVREGFVQGRNHPDDVPRMAMLFRRFRHVSYMAKAIAIWTAGDHYVAAIAERGAALHGEIRSGRGSLDQAGALLEQIGVLDQRLTPLEDAFSRTLSKGARHAKRLLLDTTVLIAALLLTIGTLLSWIMLRHIRAWEARYRHLLNTANDAIVVASLETGVILDANRRTEDLLAEAARMNLSEVVATEHLELARQMVSRKVLSGAATVYELDIVTKDGRRVPLEVSTRLMLREGKPIAVQGIARDIRERRRIETERAELLTREQAARAEAELANRAKDEFLATLSHELRTPLSAILIWARLLRSGRLDAETRARALEVIERNTKLQARLIEDLLEVSRIIAGKLRLEWTPVDLASTVDGAIDAVRAAADAKDITLALELERDLGPVRGDRNRLQQIVWNLVSNAIKFTPSGGSVNVRLARDAQDGMITVRDTGIGIRAEFLPHIFERFRQGDSTSTRIHGGPGLGLAIVPPLVALPGGTVTAASPGEGQGATFTVRLPVPAKDVEAGDAAWLSGLARRPGPSPLSLHGLHVLLVEDESDMRESVTVSLELCGARVTAVGAAPAALEILDRDPPDIVLCDIGMPDEDGYTLVRKIRSRGAERGGQIPAVALTAYARDEDRSRALDAGFQIHVAKPVEPTEIARVVADLCRSTARVGRVAAARGR